jgi:hypothetical protein
MPTITHEAYISAVAEIAKGLLVPEERAIVDQIKLVYGAGQSGLRGVTYYHKWNGAKGAEPAPFVEVCAFGQDSWLQVAGTTIHELGHVLAGFGSGHGPLWHKACERMGLRKIRAAGTEYKWAMFNPAIRERIALLPRPDDGEPVKALSGLSGLPTMKACPVGIGTRGGKSRGKGSGSRLRLWECECEPKPFKARVASDNFDATCNCCHANFHLAS